MAADPRTLSLWFDQLGEAVVPRPGLTGATTADVAIVGAGFTGLWTAYYLLVREPTLRVVIVDKHIAGFGASGRNGGWCSALYPVSAATLAAECGAASARAQYAAVRDSVGEVVRVARFEGIDAEVAVGGTVVLARSEPQLDRARHAVADADRWGIDLQLLDRAQARQRLNATRVIGATYTPDCAAVQPAKLVRGLAARVEARGARIAEGTTALAIEPHAVHTDRGSVRADIVIRATEGFTAQLAGMRRELAPVYSLVIATQPLAESVWDEIGLRQRETFSDYRHLIIYGQRSADGRMVFGGRGAPYHFRSRIRAHYDREPAVFAALQATLIDLFPQLRGVPITHRWGGPLGIARDWHARVGLDRASGMGWAGGYVGDGVATANLAGRTLSDLVLGEQTELTRLPWVGHRGRRWEPEPLRWLAVNAGLRAMTLADATERRLGRPSRLASMVNAMMAR